MDILKKIIKKILFPHIAFVLVLFPISMVFIIYCMLCLKSTSIMTYFSYGLAFYSLLIFCLRLPQIIKLIKKIINDNKYMIKYKEDVNLRINISLFSSLTINIAYSIFQLCLGFYHKSLWYFSMSFYYAILSLMKIFLVNYTKKKKKYENILTEYKKANFCGWMMLIMNIAVSTIFFIIIYDGKTFYHHQITTIALAAYTFFAFGLSIYNFIKYRKFNSPVYSSSKSINLVACCVSMMTMTSTMLTTFSDENTFQFKIVMLTSLGIVITLFILIISISIIISSSKKIKKNKGDIY